VRWQIFARDNFRCRYCGRQAGDGGVVLQVEHIISVADGGTNAMDNLLSACQKCNNGKRTRSLQYAPGSEDAVAFASAQAVTLAQQARALAAQSDARAELKQELINLLCDAYGYESIYISETNVKQFIGILQTYGAARLAEWVAIAASRRIRPSQCCRYVFGIIRNLKSRHDEAV
jgi:hypothetical protein